MKTKIVTLSLMACSLSGLSAFAQSPQLTGDYIATLKDCPYLVQITALPRPGNVIHIDAGPRGFTVSFNFVCTSADSCSVGQVAREELFGAQVGSFSQSGEGGIQVVDGEYSNGGNRFVETVDDIGLPDQQGSPHTPYVRLEATKTEGGVDLFYIGASSCHLTRSN